MGSDGTGHPEALIEVGCAVRSGPDPEVGAREAAREALAALRRSPPSAVLVFASAHQDAAAVARGVRAVCGAAPFLGATTADEGGRGGVILNGEHAGAVVVSAVGSPYLSVRVGVGEGVSRDWQAALDQALACPALAGLFDGSGDAWLELTRRGEGVFAFVSAPGETPGAPSRSFQIVEALKRRSLGRLPIFGGSSACDWPAENHHVFGDGRAVRDGLVLAVFETQLRFGIALAHGFRETGTRLTVTRCREEEVLEFDGRSAAAAYADAMGVPLGALDGEQATRVTGRPLGSPDAAGQLIPYLARHVTAGGGVVFNRAVPPGAVLSVLVPDREGGLDAGPAALRKAALRAGVVEPAVAVGALCPTRFRLFGEGAAEEVPRMVRALGRTPLVGFRSWGEQGLTDDGVANHTNAVISVLVLGKELSPIAHVARENEHLRRRAEVQQRRAQAELERQVAERTAQLVAAGEERSRMLEQLMHADRLAAMGRLAAGVGHEINNPLTYVLSALSGLGDELVGLEAQVAPERVAGVRRMLAEAKGGLERIREAVRELKAFTRVDDGPLQSLTVEPVLEASVQLALNELRHRARLVKEYGSTPAVLAHEARLGQVFLNLLVNAAQAIPEGAADRHEIRLVTRTEPSGHVLVEIHDTGAGIPRQDLDRVFEPFFTTRQARGSTGLGLSISRSLVAAMGGSLSVESLVGRGSCFFVRLPPAAPAPRAAPRGPAAGACRARILVVDDEPLVLNAVRRTLGKEHELVAEQSARAALARLERGEPFDLVVCDLMMPEMGGAELHAALRAVRPELVARTVFLTGGAFTSGARAFLESVPNACLEKPFDPDVLRARVRELLETAGGG